MVSSTRCATLGGLLLITRGSAPPRNGGSILLCEGDVCALWYKTPQSTREAPNFGECPECELRHTGVPRSFTTENRSSRAVPLALGAHAGAFLRLVLLRGTLGNPHESHPKRRPQRREHERESPDRRRQQRYLHHHEGRDHQPFPGHGGGGDLQHVEGDGRRYGGEAPAGGEADQRDVVRPLDPPLDTLAEGDGRQEERQDPGRSLYQGYREPAARVV